MKMSRRVPLRILSFAVAAGIAVAFAFAVTVHIWGARTLIWPGFKVLLVFVYPFARVPARASLYPIFLLTVALNAAYYAIVAMIAIYVRRRVVSTVRVALVIVLVIFVAGPILHVAFERVGMVRIQ